MQDLYIGIMRLFVYFLLYVYLLVRIERINEVLWTCTHALEPEVVMLGGWGYFYYFTTSVIREIPKVHLAISFFLPQVFSVEHCSYSAYVNCVLLDYISYFCLQFPLRRHDIRANNSNAKISAIQTCSLPRGYIYEGLVPLVATYVDNVI